MREQIIELLNKHYRFKKGVRITENTELITGSNVISVNVRELANDLEETFAITLTPDDIEMDDFSTIRRIELLVTRCQQRDRHLQSS